MGSCRLYGPNMTQRASRHLLGATTGALITKSAVLQPCLTFAGILIIENIDQSSSDFRPLAQEARWVEKLTSEVVS
jgi:hypothetical protein